MPNGIMKGETWNDFIENEVLKNIWNTHLIFEGGCGSGHWVDSDYMFQSIAQMFEVNVVWYTILNENETKTITTCYIISKKMVWIHNPDVHIDGSGW